MQRNPCHVSSHDSCLKRFTSKTPQSALIINEWYLNSYHCIIYRHFLSSPSGAVVPWHLTKQLWGRQAAISFEASPCPGDRQRDEWKHTDEGFISLIAFTGFLWHRHVSMIKHSGIRTCKDAHRCKSNCGCKVIHHFTISIKGRLLNKNDCIIFIQNVF